MPEQLRTLLRVAGLLLAAGCGGHTVPEQPSWADVQPILRGECSGCHGSTAPQTGFNYRLDFLDQPSLAMACGEAAIAIPPATAPTFGPVLAGAAAALIYQDIEPGTAGGPPKMPPEPGAPLYDWERETLENWTAAPSFVGSPPPGNRAPTIQVTQLPPTGKTDVSFVAVLGDPDGDDVVGVIEIAGQPIFSMNRSGSFAVDLDASTWPSGSQQLNAVLCDGWTNVSVPLVSLVVNR